MRLLTALIAGLIMLATTAFTSPIAEAQPHPHVHGQQASFQSVGIPNGTDHGVDPETFYALWAGDEDILDEQALEDLTTTDNATRAMAVLGAGTDVPFDAPPRAVEQWNRGDLRDIPSGGREVAVHPPHATVQGGQYVKDAAVSIFAVQPATRARLTSGDEPLYVAPSGAVLGSVDYRIEVPDAIGMVGDRVYWRLQRVSIESTELYVDGQLETSVGGTRRPVIRYDDLDEYTGETHTLTLEVNLTVEVDRITETCEEWSHQNRCLDIDRTTDDQDRSLILSDSVHVEVYDLEVSGFRARYPNGDLGLVVFKNQPWLGYTLPDGAVNGVWRFYTARDARWDSLIRYDEDGDVEIDSPAQPLTVHAYPIETGPTPSPRRAVELLYVYGDEIDPPTLPEEVRLDILDEPYTGSFGIATRTRNGTINSVTATGLVRGVTARPDPSVFPAVAINESNLTLSVLEHDAETLTVQVTLRDNQSGAPIATDDREGYVVLAGERVNTTADGTAVRTIPRSLGVIAARYEPGRWWQHGIGYTGSSAVVVGPGFAIASWADLYAMLEIIGAFLLGVFLIDRITGWRVWPPWRWVR